MVNVARFVFEQACLLDATPSPDFCSFCGALTQSEPPARHTNSKDNIAQLVLVLVYEVTPATGVFTKMTRP
jgi:hypothetical protein